MLEGFLRFFIMLFFVLAGGAGVSLASPFLAVYVGAEYFHSDISEVGLTMANMVCIFLGALFFGILGSFIAPWAARQLRRIAVWTGGKLGRVPIYDVVAGAFGLAVGLVIANLFSYSISKLPIFGEYLPILISIVLGYTGIYIAIQKRGEFGETVGFLPQMAKDLAELRAEREQAPKEAPLPRKLLDTSVIIDGRIADIAKTGFIEGELVVPVFVLEELQHIADSADSLKRTRGRRGLDILQRMREGEDIPVVVESKDYEDIYEVDSKLVRLAKDAGAKILTNDFNLNKVASLQGVQVLNINDLANAVKPEFIPGETMVVTIVKQGKEAGQGLAYLDDGMMIVVEDGYYHMNETITVEVTSALQTAAGRIIFAKPIHEA